MNKKGGKDRESEREEQKEPKKTKRERINQKETDDHAKEELKKGFKGKFTLSPSSLDPRLFCNKVLLQCLDKYFGKLDFFLAWNRL